jgi:hypothetical protein
VENVRLLIFCLTRGVRAIDVEVSRVENRKTSVINDTAMSELAPFHRTIILFLHNACRYQHSFYTSLHLVIAITLQVLKSAPWNGRAPSGVKFVCKFPVES